MSAPPRYPRSGVSPDLVATSVTVVEGGVGEGVGLGDGEGLGEGEGLGATVYDIDAVPLQIVPLTFQ